MGIQVSNDKPITSVADLEGYRSQPIFAGMEIDSPAWVAFAASDDLAELRLLPVPKMPQMVGSHEKRGRLGRRSRLQIGSRRCSGHLSRGLSRAATRRTRTAASCSSGTHCPGPCHGDRLTGQDDVRVTSR